jgi:hypothetical protein
MYFTSKLNPPNLLIDILIGLILGVPFLLELAAMQVEMGPESYTGREIRIIDDLNSLKLNPMT